MIKIGPSTYKPSGSLPVSACISGASFPVKNVQVNTPQMPKPLSQEIQENLVSLSTTERNRKSAKCMIDTVRKSAVNTKNGKRLVLDLDETLVHTFDHENELNNFVNELDNEDKKRIYKINFGANGAYLWGYVRPHAEVFLDMVFQEFESVAVWSAGTHEYVHKIVQIVFINHTPDFIMTRNDCNEILVDSREPVCRYKPLEIIYDRYPNYTRENTLIVDDRHDICALNCTNNIKIPAFFIDEDNYETMIGDFTLLILASWFQTPFFRQTTNVQGIKSKSPFKLETV